MIIKNPTIIIKGSGGGEEPDPVTTSPALFTIDGSTITEYIGTEPNVIIPISYSRSYEEGVSEGLPISSSQYYSLSNLDSMISMTFTDGSKTMTFSSFDTLESDLSSNFPDNCYLIYAQASDPFAFYFLQDFYDITNITIWGKVFNSNMDAIEHITGLNMTTVCFMGAYLEKANIPGKDINITEISYNSRPYENIKNLTILKNITNMSANPFRNSPELETITVDESNTKYKSLNNCLIDKTNNSLVVGCKNSVIPDSVTGIGTRAFQGCHGLTSIIIPNSVTSIGTYSFHSCSSLGSIDIPDSVTSIGEYAFSSCINLGSITIPNSVTSIGTYSFSYCNSLGSINIPGSVTSITRYAFYNCTGLESVTLGDGVTDIGSSAFNGCKSLKTIEIPDSVTIIRQYAFSNCINLGSITIPNSVTIIEGGVFKGCTSLGNIEIPSGVTSIGAQTFMNCTALTTMTILATTPPTLGNTNAIPSNVTAIYIPAGTLSAYQTATNWSNFADKFVELAA